VTSADARSHRLARAPADIAALSLCPNAPCGMGHLPPGICAALRRWRDRARL